MGVTPDQPLTGSLWHPSQPAAPVPCQVGGSLPRPRRHACSAPPRGDSSSVKPRRWIGNPGEPQWPAGAQRHGTAESDIRAEGLRDIGKPLSHALKASLSKKPESSRGHRSLWPSSVDPAACPQPRGCSCFRGPDTAGLVCVFALSPPPSLRSGPQWLAPTLSPRPPAWLEQRLDGICREHFLISSQEVRFNCGLERLFPVGLWLGISHSSSVSCTLA